VNPIKTDTLTGALSDPHSRRRFLLTGVGVGGTLFLAACGSSSDSGSSSSGGSTITFAGYGGTTQNAQMNSWGKEFTDATGNQVQAATVDYGKLKAMVDSGNVTWDAAVVEGFFAHTPGNQSLFTPIDKSKINGDWLDSVAGDGPEGDQVTDASVACYQYSFALAHSTDGDEAIPGDWPEFFDTEKFPGKRALYSVPYGMIEIALLGDGVAWDDMYPLDVDRALAKIESLGDNVTYWSTGAQSQQMLIGGSADFVALWDVRAATLMKQGRAVDIMWNQNIRTADHLIVPNGSKLADEGMEFISAAIDPKAQAAAADEVLLGPTNPETNPMINQADFELLAAAHVDVSAGYIDNSYWGENYESVLEKYNSVVAG
jgi:putative spermidine/putrescine transport system substrate-binding protein